MALIEGLPTLPIHEVLPELGQALSHVGKNAVLVAPPGAGKTTRVPLFLMEQNWVNEGRIILLEPRRIAARSAARHMAGLLGETLGQTVGLRVRFETLVSAKTRIEVVTEGVFTRMALDDPELSGISAVVFDEFHERSLDADLGLALALDIQRAFRPDLRILPMSATLDGARVARLVEPATVIESPGRSYPVSVRYCPPLQHSRIEDAVFEAVLDVLASEEGSVLVFLPGQGEIRRILDRLDGKLPSDVSLHGLFGSMDMQAQDAAISPPQSGNRKVVLATAIAQTSLTIEGIRIVIDSGLSRVPRFEPATGLTRLETVKASKATVDQRAGRAGRTAPGTVIRLWPEPHTKGLVPFDRAEITEADLTGLVLNLAEWGVSDPHQLAWLDLPPAGAWKRAVQTLTDLEAIGLNGGLTETGKKLRSVPLAPKLAAMVVRAAELGCGEQAAKLALLVSERGLGGNSTDLTERLQHLNQNGGQRNTKALRLATSIVTNLKAVNLPSSENRTSSNESICHNQDWTAGSILSLAFPDRIAKSSGKPGSFQLANGRRGYLDETHPLARAEMLVVTDVQGGAERPRITEAIALDRHEFERLWHNKISRARDIEFDQTSGAFRASEVVKFQKLTLSRQQSELKPTDNLEPALVNLLAEQGMNCLPIDKDTESLMMRMQFAHVNLSTSQKAWPDSSPEHLAETAQDWLLPFVPGITRLSDISTTVIRNALLARAYEALPELARTPIDTMLPNALMVPTGSRIPLRYEENRVVASVRVQEMYGLDEHPTILDGTLPVTLELLSPAQRPIQLTNDLPGFWRGSWKDVQIEMKGRYPKHFWPDAPQSAKATTRAKPRGS